MIKKVSELSTFLRLKVDYAFPKHCLLCLASGTKSSICAQCARDFPPPATGCTICGEQLTAVSTKTVDNTPLTDKGQAVTDPTETRQYCGHCLTSPPAYRFCRSAFRYDFPIRQIIHRLKYHEEGFWGAPLADAAWPAFKASFANYSKALLLPVPMHASQYQQRRDNHAELIATRLGAWSGFRVDTQLVSKQVNTTRQAELSGKARRLNLKHAFAINKNANPPQAPIIIVDDVSTTGTTVNAIAKLIKNHYDQEIFGFTLAKRSLADADFLL